MNLLSRHLISILLIGTLIAIPTSMYAMLAAVQDGNTGELRRLLEAKANPNEETDGLDNTPLHRAAGRNNLAIAQLLVAFNANVHAANIIGSTPLSIAQEHDHAEMIKLLSGSQADNAQLLAHLEVSDESSTSRDGSPDISLSILEIQPQSPAQQHRQLPSKLLKAIRQGRTPTPSPNSEEKEKESYDIS